MLHLVSRSPFETRSLERCLCRTGAGDTLLLIEDGVYAARRGSAAAERLETALQHMAVCALEPDLYARGISPADLLAGIRLVDYSGFVALAVEHTAVQSWF